ncbi:MAG: riboflavin synthase [Nitrospirota bacterium]
MFTGIIEELGTVKAINKGRESATLEIGAEKVVEGLNLGDSVAVNGVCLTVIDFDNEQSRRKSNGFTAEVMAETLRKSNLGRLKSGDRVNLERAMRLGDRLGGHLVAGHVDATGTIKSTVREDIATVFTVEAPEDILRYVIEKGSVAIDGISLTVVDYDKKSFRVSIIPHTASQTTLGFKKSGDTVNLEADMLAKFVERLLAGRAGKEGIDKDFLGRHGFM